MKKIGIMPNLEKDTNLEFTRTIVDFIVSKGCRPCVSQLVAKAGKFEKYLTSIEEIYKSDFIIVIGGDGTFLSVARQASTYDTKILGINFGSLGFLTDVEKDNALPVIENVINGKYKTEKRMMLEANILTQEIESDRYIGLNDICITRGVFSKVIDLKVFVNDQYYYTFRADGIIFSTPTGSTAYNLAAGGPILKPDTDMFVITPIAPHTLYSRSSVLSSKDVVKVEVVNQTNPDILLSIDGQTGVALHTGDIIQIKKSKNYARVIKTSSLSFYDIVREKMIDFRR